LGKLKHDLEKTEKFGQNSLYGSARTLKLHVGFEQGCKKDDPRPDFLSPSPFSLYLLLKSTQKGDGKPTQKPSLLQAWFRMCDFEIQGGDAF
jgi:hypothetical protein